MSTKTKNLGLVKPDPEDIVDIRELNNNADIIDSKMKDFQDKFGSIAVVETAAEMKDTDKVYVYAGNESGYKTDYWYYYKDGSWKEGRPFNSNGIKTDKNLEEDGVAADAAATGAAVSELKEDLVNYEDGINDLFAIKRCYLNSSNFEEGNYYYGYDTPYKKSVPSSTKEYRCAPPFKLKKGTYYFSTINLMFTWYTDSSGYHRFNEKTQNPGGGIITFDEDVTIYHSIEVDRLQYTYIIDGNESMDSNYPSVGIIDYYIPYNSKSYLLVGNTSDCDYATIQDAITNCNDSASNPIVIFIKNGSYGQFSMTDNYKKGVRYISLIGESRENVIVRGNKGKYEEPTSEIRTIGAVKNITFVQETSIETQETGGAYKYCYAMHDDYDGTNVEYENCTFISNAGPAVGLGLRANSMKTFRNCYFENNGDGTFGSIDLGAFYCHSYWKDAENQGIIIENCTAVNKKGLYGFKLDKIVGYTATFKAHIRNCGTFGNGVASGTSTIPLTFSYGNNVDSLNVI